ncbi:hypothetical protein HD806DRAFT_272940 [Xylariaceae sp. AK1471]|nr:hypothetical protein HD806DRAFT_272940 [Xylariaceae sp. AK1471]
MATVRPVFPVERNLLGWLGDTSLQPSCPAEVSYYACWDDASDIALTPTQSWCPRWYNSESSEPTTFSISFVKGHGRSRRRLGFCVRYILGILYPLRPSGCTSDTPKQQQVKRLGLAVTEIGRRVANNTLLQRWHPPGPRRSTRAPLVYSNMESTKTHRFHLGRAKNVVAVERVPAHYIVGIVYFPLLCLRTSGTANRHPPGPSRRAHVSPAYCSMESTKPSQFHLRRSTDTAAAQELHHSLGISLHPIYLASRHTSGTAKQPR